MKIHVTGIEFDHLDAVLRPEESEHLRHVLERAINELDLDDAQRRAAQTVHLALMKRRIQTWGGS